MKAFIFSTIAFFISVFSYASSLQCEIKSNLITVIKVEVPTKDFEKTFIAEFQSIRTYITEQKKDHFIVEVFLPDYEMRLYAEGDLTSNSNILTASYWGRDRMLDVSCWRKI